MGALMWTVFLLRQGGRWDETMVWPVLQPTLQSVGLQSSEVRVSTVSLDATRRRVDGTVSTVSDGIEVDNGDMTQWDSQIQLGSGLPLRGGGVRSVWIVVLVWCGGPNNETRIIAASEYSFILRRNYETVVKLLKQN